jgi:predicted AAA+ superfamily ATPase
MTGPYHAREVTARLAAALAEMPVVVLTGMRQTGKTTLLRADPAFAERRYISLDDFASREAAERNPEGLLEGTQPLTIDEAQRVPTLLPAIKRIVDRQRRPGQYLLSGSANFHLLRGVSESLAGRAIYLTLHPMHRRELRGAIRPTPLVRELFEHGTLPRRPEAAPLDPTEILRGGMPTVALGHVREPDIWFRGFEQTYLERDLRDLTQVADLTAFRTLLRLSALRTGQVLNQSELARDAKLTVATTTRYLSLLETSFLVARLPSYRTSRVSRLIKAPKLHFGDAGLAAYLSGVRALMPVADEPMAGALLETYVYQNLAALCEAAWPAAELAYWHVQGRHEVDFIIRVGRDTLAVEVTFASRWGERDLRGLQTFLDSDRRCRGAILAHGGAASVQLGEKLWAIPVATLLA